MRGRPKGQRMSGKITIKRKRAKVEKIEPGSGNVFADLGLPDAQEWMLKAQLAARIAELIERKGWTQARAAEVFGLDQPKVSHLLRGRLSGFSAERLFAVLNHLGHSVEVQISAEESAPGKASTRVSFA